MKPRIKLVITIVVMLAYTGVSCKKDWLEAKPDQSLAVPVSIADYQSLLDNTAGEENGAPMNKVHSILDEAGTTDMYVTDMVYGNLAPLQKNIYLWAANMYEGTTDYSEWGYAYQRIYYSNVVNDGIDKIKPSTVQEELEWKQVKGSALFFRAMSHYDVARRYCKPYDLSTAATDRGIPLRLIPDFNITSKRSSVEETYHQILNDLKESARILPVPHPLSGSHLYRIRPTKGAAEALLSRVYLAMGNYDSAFRYADLCLGHYNSLLDYNTRVVSPNTSTTFTMFNPEVIFHMEGGTSAVLRSSNMAVDTFLYNSYHANDLRKELFFRSNGGHYRFRGSYCGTSAFFAGLATDELYLIRSECYARKGLVSDAMSDLNTLMQKRWTSTVPYPVIMASNQDEALNIILQERRKELCFRGIRWTDLRRLNKDPNRQVTMSRVINGQTFTLPPNDPRYVFLIPPSVILMTGMEQNPR